MAIFAIGDLHLAFSVPEKSMEFFGERWEKYTERIEKGWRAHVAAEDLVLIPGDISWAKNLEQASQDLKWIDALPGTKLLLRGNHDYWWSSISQVKKILPPSMHLLQNNAFDWGDVSIGGSRLWDTDEFSFDGYIDFIESPRIKMVNQPQDLEEQERIFVRELRRLEISLKALRRYAAVKIVMTHYPPIGPLPFQSSRVSQLLEKYGVQLCVFGHLHNVKKECALFGLFNTIQYILVAADYIDFCPIRIH